MARFRAKTIALERRDAAARARVTREAETPLMLLLGVTGVVLLIACANIANLLLARGGRRAPARWRCGCRSARAGGSSSASCSPSRAAGALGGVAGLRGRALDARQLIASLLPAEARRLDRVPGSIAPVLLFAAALALGTGLLFGLFPALHSTRPISSSHRSRARPASPRARAPPRASARRSPRRRSRSRWRCSCRRACSSRA